MKIKVILVSLGVCLLNANVSFSASHGAEEDTRTVTWASEYVNRPAKPINPSTFTTLEALKGYCMAIHEGKLPAGDGLRAIAVTASTAPFSLTSNAQVAMLSDLMGGEGDTTIFPKVEDVRFFGMFGKNVDDPDVKGMLVARTRAERDMRFRGETTLNALKETAVQVFYDWLKGVGLELPAREVTVDDVLEFRAKVSKSMILRNDTHVQGLRGLTKFNPDLRPEVQLVAVFNPAILPSAEMVSTAAHTKAMNQQASAVLAYSAVTERAAAVTKQLNDLIAGPVAQLLGELRGLSAEGRGAGAGLDSARAAPGVPSPTGGRPAGEDAGAALSASGIGGGAKAADGAS